MSGTRRPWLKLKKVPSPFWRGVLEAAGAQPAASEAETDDTAFPGQPGSRWRDADGHEWIHSGAGFVHMTYKQPTAERIAEIYGPMTRVGGES